MEGLEELRMLTNINANKDELIQLILVGQPELRDLLARGNTIGAVKLYRERTGLGLKESKDAVDTLARQLKS